MAKEICISSTPHETRLAILEDDQLAEIYYERENEYTLAGSIYNGRVTRVLPGMQSAFVDIGLERDAFLYVTDFIELEDQEETDELEKAAATGANQAPREVRHENAQAHGSQVRTNQERGNGRSDERGGYSDQKQESRQESRQDQQRPAGDRRPAPETAPETVIAETPAVATQAGEAQENAADAGGRRWRGRRHRRGARGPVNAPELVTEAVDSAESFPASREAPEAPEGVAEIEVVEAHIPAPEPRAAHTPVPFVLPGESLSKYGGTAAEESAGAVEETPAPVRPSGFSKPSTLVETPIVWDGSGLLPGESISKHRARASEPDTDAEPISETGDAQPSLEKYEFSETSVAAPIEESLESQPDEYGIEFEEEQLESPELESVQEEQPSVSEGVSEGEAEQVAAGTLTTEEMEETESEETENDASASHRVDPTSPTGFRLFGLGGKKKKDEEPVPEKVKPVSPAYQPGAGVIEEEVIEGEELEAPRHRHRKAEEQDLDDYEEETLPTHLRSGDLGEMLQEAHLDHRIQLNFDGKTGEDEEDIEGEDEADPGAPAGAQPGVAADAGQPRRDRGGRGRRGRGGQQPQSNRRGGMSRRSMQTSDLPIISDLLKSGQEILVQIAKEPIAKKGARITSHIALPGRFLVFMPTVTHVGVSRKIASDEERQRLKRILVHERGDTTGGFIVRTAAEGASEEDLRADLRFLINLWSDIKQRSDSSKSPALIYHDLSLIERILRDQVSANFSNIWVDSEADYERIVRFLNRFSPSLVRRVKLYTKELPLFEHFGIQDEISKALRSKVWLKSGGSIVINQTEALVAIDINTGKYVGKSARLEDTIVKTNLDAVPEIVRQIRLRDLGGIIVIDFIDMDDRKNRFRVLAALEEALKSDRAPTKVLQFNDFGLVAITRKRVKQSLERTLSVPCPICQATGMVKSPTTVCNEIYIELRKMKKHFEGEDVLLRVHPETVKVLKSGGASWITEFEELTGRNLLIKSDPTLHPEQFDIQG
jgi:Rne/Rng family ribonuclease